MRDLSFSRELRDLLDNNLDDPILISVILDNLQERAYGLLIILLSLPFIFPIPSVGLSTLFGGVIMICSLSIFSGLRPWVPKKMGAKGISRKTLGTLVARAEKLALWMERFVRPRGRAFSASAFWIRIHGLMIFFSALILALPLPPGGNILPALACLALAIGLMEEDGIILTLGYLLTTINVILILLLFMYGLNWLKEIL